MKNIMKIISYSLKLLFVLVSLVIFSCSSGIKTNAVKTNIADTVPPINKKLAIKPPMGWNSWDCLGWDADETEIKTASEYMAKNLKHLGYEYIIIDQGWYADAKASNFEDFVHEMMSPKPNYTIDEFGRLLPDTIKYPSSRGGKGFKPLADYIHNLGLKFGLHLLRGIPWMAAERNLSIKGTSFHASSIAQPDKGCDWYDGFYGVDMLQPGAQDYYNSVFGLFADWGVDFIKADDVVNIQELEGISRASRVCGRDIVLSVVPGDIPYNVLKKNAHMARTGFDLWDNWQMLKVGFPVVAKAVNEAEAGFWPDLDMLPIGKLGLKISYKGPDPRISNFNLSELHSLLSLWYISRMPLIIGGYLPETDIRTLELLQNEEALAVNRNAINPRQIKLKNAVVIWAADLPNSDDKYLCFFNQWESKDPININLKLEQIGLNANSQYKVRDLWAKKDLGLFNDKFSALISAHDAGLYKITRNQ